MDPSDETFVTTVEASDIEPPKSSKSNRFIRPKNCLSCGTDDTPMWRRGPQGGNTLCNACGIKYSLQQRGIRKSKKGLALISLFTKSASKRSCQTNRDLLSTRAVA